MLNRDVVRSWCITWGVWAILAAAFVLSLLVDGLSVYYRLPIIDITRPQLVGYNLLSYRVIRGGERSNTTTFIPRG
jgi:hypothetical protein